jgi:hypothetical protein
METVMIDGVVDGTAPKDEADEKIEIRFEEMDDSELVKFEQTEFLVNHCVDNMNQSVKVHATFGNTSGEVVDHMQQEDSFGLSRDTLGVLGIVKFGSAVDMCGDDTLLES